MLVHVFDTLRTVEQEEGNSILFSLFLTRAAKASTVTARRDGEYLVLEGVKKKKDNEFKVEWSSGIIYQKLRVVPPSLSLPVIWKLCRYYYGSNGIEVVSDAIRGYLHNELGVVLEHAPFTLEKNGTLITRCQETKVTLPEEVDPDQIEIRVDKQGLDVILLPHRGVAHTLLLLLKEFL